MREPPHVRGFPWQDAAMHFRRARAPIAVIMLLALGIWAASAFADRPLPVVAIALTDTISTDTTATSPSTDTTATTDTTTSAGGGVTDTSPVETATAPVVTTTPAATTPTPAATPAGASTTPATASDPSAAATTVSVGTASQTAATAASTASAPSATATGANAKGTLTAKKRRARSSGVAGLGSRTIQPAGGIIPKARHRHASSKVQTKTATTTNATRSKVKAHHAAKAKARTAKTSASASGGRRDAASSRQAPPSPNEHGGIGLETPRGRLSVSPTGFHLGGSERSIASVNGLLTAVLDTLAVLAALAAAIGAGTFASRVRRNRQAAAGRASVVATTRRTRAQLYDEARRQNIPGRSSMTKAQLERALHPPEPVRERDADRVPRSEALSWVRDLRVPLPRGARGNGR
jgi:hypothetical protein